MSEGTSTASTCPPPATFCPQAREVDPLRFAEVLLSDPATAAKVPDLAERFHPDFHPQVAATLRWASEQGQAILLGDPQGDFDVMHCQVHLNLDAPMLGARFAPYGYLHLMLHDLTHHYLGQVRVRPEDVATPERLRETRKHIHQVAMLAELVASFATVSRIIPEYSSWRSDALGEGSPDQFGGFFSFARSEREVVDGWKALYGGGATFREFLRRELDEAHVLAKRRAGDWLVWPGLARLLRLERGPRWLVDGLHRLEAKLAVGLLPTLLPWAYWNRSVYSVASFQADCHHLAERYTSPWHIRWQADFAEGAPADEVLRRCHTAFRGLVMRDYGFFDAAPNDLGPGGYALNVRRQQVRHLARKVYELEHHLTSGSAIYTGGEADRAAWLALIAKFRAKAMDLFWGMTPRDCVARYERELLPLRAELLALWEDDAPRFDLPACRRDFLANPNRQLFDPGVRDANSKPPAKKTWRQRWADLRALWRSLRGQPVSAEEREWVLEVYAGLDHQAVFDEAEAWGIPTVGRDQPPPAHRRPPALRVHESALGRVEADDEGDERRAA